MNFFCALWVIHILRICITYACACVRGFSLCLCFLLNKKSLNQIPKPRPKLSLTNTTKIKQNPLKYQSKPKRQPKTPTSTKKRLKQKYRGFGRSSWSPDQDQDHGQGQGQHGGNRKPKAIEKRMFLGGNNLFFESQNQDQKAIKPAQTDSEME